MRQIAVIMPGGVTGRGGMSRMAATFTRRLAREPDFPYEVIDSYGSRLNAAGGKLRMPIHFVGALLRAAAGCISGRTKLAHLHVAKAGSIVRKIALFRVYRTFGVPTILHLHAGDLPESCVAHPRLASLLRRSLPHMAEVIVLGEHWRRFVIDTLAAPPDRVTVLPNGVDGPLAVPDRRDRAGCHILFLGLVTEQKGMDDLVAALAAPALAGSDWRITIAGSGQIEHYAAMCEALGIGARVSFAGWVEEPETRRLLEAADLLVLPSHFECMPMAIIEAMAYGLPVVATEVGAVAEVVREGETGFLVAPRDRAGLTRALAALVGDRDCRSRMGANGRRRFCQEYDIEVFNARLTTIYRRHMKR